MEETMVIGGKQVENLITRFYYQNKQLYFQIILNLGLKGKVLYREFDDYFTYKQAFNELLQAKNENMDIIVPLHANVA